MTPHFLKVEDEEIMLKACLWFNNHDQNGNNSHISIYYNIIRKNDNVTVGHCGIRTEDNEKNHYLGNVEYEIFEQFQGNNYAYKATKLLGQVALDLGVQELKITTRPDNIPSVRTIDKLGAEFICIQKVPRKFKLHNDSKKVAIYNWKIESEKLK